MPSHGVSAVLEVEALGSGRARLRFRLECGCELDAELPDERLIDRPDGGQILVGKYPCPEGHGPRPR